MTRTLRNAPSSFDFRIVLLGLMAGTFAACSDSDDVVVTPPAPIGSVTFLANLRAEDITPDGSTVLLTDVTSPAAAFHFYDTTSDTSMLMGEAGDALFNFVSGISSGLRVSAIHGKPENAGLWTEAGGWIDLGNIYPVGCEYDAMTHEQNQSGGWDVSADGTATVGLVWNVCVAEAFWWSDAGGPGAFVPLDVLGAPFPGDTDPPNNRATKIADDGSLAGGFAQTEMVDRWPAVWDPSGAGMLIPSGGMFTDDSPGEVLSISADGAMVAGTWNLEGFQWTQAGGVVKLGTPPGGRTFPNTIAADGELIFGQTSTGLFDPPFAFVWTVADGMQSLADILAVNGIAIPVGLTLDNVKAASTDGTIVVGNATDATFATSTFVLRLPVSAYGI